MSYHFPEISELAFLSDCQSAALIDRGGRVLWWCPPRFDAPAVFSGLLDPSGGTWSIGEDWELLDRQYYGPTLVLESQWRTPTGTVHTRDALLLGLGEREHHIGHDSPHLLIRQVTCLTGSQSLSTRIAIRPHFGAGRGLIQPDRNGLSVRSGNQRFFPLGPGWRAERSDLVADAVLMEGQSVTFGLRVTDGDAVPPSEVSLAWWLRDTVAAWESWSGIHQHYQGPYAAEVHRSGRILQGLTFAPTGAVVAAATTSLPESRQGRVWDYRYAWLRDASMTMQAQWIAACPDEAQRFFAWIIGATRARIERQPERGLQIMFGVRGEHDLSEHSLEHLTGWRGIGPVRIGNDAWQQTQHDVNGEILDALDRLREHVTLDEPDRVLIRGIVDIAADQWQQPGQGMWERRGEPRRYTHSALQCWVALDRALDLTDFLQPSAAQRRRWEQVRSDIADCLVSDTWSESGNSYSAVLGADALDASTLLLSLRGLIPADSPKMLATAERIAKELSTPSGLVLRYRDDDGLPGNEGGFLICTFWLAEFYALAGDIALAEQIFATALRYANDVGILAEQGDTENGASWGNTPQAFSHVGLINAAFAIDTARSAHAR